MDPRRAERVAGVLREELAEIIEYEMSDPRLAAVVVTDVQVSRDLRHAQVRVLLSGNPRVQRDALAALEGARHYIRREVAGRIRLWRIPELHFSPDAGTDAPGRVEELLKRISNARPGAEKPGN